MERFSKFEGERGPQCNLMLEHFSTLNAAHQDAQECDTDATSYIFIYERWQHKARICKTCNLLWTFLSYRTHVLVAEAVQCFV